MHFFDFHTNDIPKQRDFLNLFTILFLFGHKTSETELQILRQNKSNFLSIKCLVIIKIFVQMGKLLD